jgi:hypothetical protein
MNVSPKSLRDAADFMKQASGVDPTWLREAADEIERLQDRLSFAEFEWNRATEGMIERDAVIEKQSNQLVSKTKILNRYRRGLVSIAANTCCDRCQEAALVAQGALTDDQGKV